MFGATRWATQSLADGLPHRNRDENQAASEWIAQSHTDDLCTMDHNGSVERIADPDLESGAEIKGWNEIEHARSKLDQVREVLDRLRLWHEWEIRRRRSLRSYLLSKVFPRRPPCPPLLELKQLATFFFPPRASLKVTICDYGEERFERHETLVCNIELGRFMPSVLSFSSAKGTTQSSRESQSG